VPSAVSAIKISGERSYARVRAGEGVELAARPVRISRFALGSWRANEVTGVPVLDLKVEVECSTGTYVRALARDIGAALGVGGHLTALRRTHVGTFGIDAAQTLEEAERELRILPLDRVAQHCFTTLTVGEAEVSRIRHGRRLTNLTLPGNPTALSDEAGHFLALYQQAGPDAVAAAVFV
jgi:tRNA pseudouridine55 synthase